jgi:hypothetical protein
LTKKMALLIPLAIIVTVLVVYLLVGGLVVDG